jgi:capsular exopolysaccharide synthesis family protein
MNRLFEALSELEMDQPLPNGIPPAVAPHGVIQLGTRAVVLDLPMSPEESEGEQLSSEAVPTDLAPSDVPAPISSEETEAEHLLLEAVPTDVTPCDVPMPMSAEWAEAEQLLLEGILIDVASSGVPTPVSVEGPEAEQPSPEVFPKDVAPADMSMPIPAEEAAAEQPSPNVIPTEVDPSDVALLGPAQEAEREQLLPEAAPIDLSLSEVSTPMPAQEAAVAKFSQPKSAESVSARPVRVRVLPESRLVALTDPNCMGAEKFRALVTRLERLDKQSELSRFQVTSSVINEGKSLVSGNVALTLAKHFGSKTLLIEGDLHRPTLATMFGLNKMRGLSHWWSGRDQELAQFIYRMDDLPLWFLPAGRPFERPSDILRSTRFVKAFEQLASQFEWIVVDSTPMLATVEVNLWSRLVDGTLLVVREGVTPVKALKQGLRALDHPKFIGVVLNDASATHEAKYDGHYYGSPSRQSL